jgi:hypothetical protein
MESMAPNPMNTFVKCSSMALHPAADSQIALAYKFDLSNQWLAWLMKSTHKSAGGNHFNGQPAIHSHKPYEVVKNIVIHGPKR